MVEAGELSLFLGAGAAAGFLGGLTGVGSGIAIVPMLIALLVRQGLPAELVLPVTAGTTLTTMALINTLQAWAHSRADRFDLELLRAVSLPALAGAGGGALIAKVIPATWGEWALLALYVLVLMQLVLRRAVPDCAAQIRRAPRLSAARGACLAAGACTGILGTGGNTLLVPYFAHSHGLPFARAIAAASGVTILFCVGGASVYLLRATPDAPAAIAPHLIGSVHLTAVFGVALGSAITVGFGARLAGRLDPVWLRRLFTALLLASITKLAAGFHLMPADANRAVAPESSTTIAIDPASRWVVGG